MLRKINLRALQINLAPCLFWRPMLKKKMGVAGFTLLETLISLAIVSMVSLALMQSTASLLHITDRAVAAGDRALDTAISRKTFQLSVAKLIPAWTESEKDVFKGGSSLFSGVSCGAPSFDVKTPQRVIYELVNAKEGRIALEVSVGSDTWVLESFPAVEARFSYLGEDQKWYPDWPPALAPTTSYNAVKQWRKPPQLPLAIRLRSVGDESMAWVVTIGGDVNVPYRDKAL